MAKAYFRIRITRRGEGSVANNIDDFTDVLPERMHKAIRKAIARGIKIELEKGNGEMSPDPRRPGHYSKRWLITEGLYSDRRGFVQVINSQGYHDVQSFLRYRKGNAITATFKSGNAVNYAFYGNKPIFGSMITPRADSVDKAKALLFWSKGGWVYASRVNPYSMSSPFVMWFNDTLRNGILLGKELYREEKLDAD